MLDDSPALLNAWVLGALLVTYTGYTLFNIPYLAMPAEMTTHYHVRTSLMSWRTVFINVGALIAAFSFALVQWLGNDRQAHGAMGLIFADADCLRLHLLLFRSLNSAPDHCREARAQAFNRAPDPHHRVEPAADEPAGRQALPIAGACGRQFRGRLFQDRDPQDELRANDLVPGGEHRRDPARHSRCGTACHTGTANG